MIIGVNEFQELLRQGIVSDKIGMGSQLGRVTHALDSYNATLIM